MGDKKSETSKTSQNYTEDKLMIQKPENPSMGKTILDVVLINREGVNENVRPKGFSAAKILECNIVYNGFTGHRMAYS